MNPSTEDAVPAPGPVPDAQPERTFSPPAGVIIGTLVAGFVFVVVLEFLVIISFVGQRMWSDPGLLTQPLNLLPLLLWIVVAAVASVMVLRVITAWLQLDETGFRLQSLMRRPVTGTWQDVGRVLAVRDIDHGATPAEMLDAPSTSYDGVYLLDANGQRILAVSSRLFGRRAQEATLRRAQAAGVPVDTVDAITPAELRKRAPQAVGFMDRHPNLLMAGLALFYIGHNLLTFIVWGL